MTPDMWLAFILFLGLLGSLFYTSKVLRDLRISENNNDAIRLNKVIAQMKKDADEAYSHNCAHLAMMRDTIKVQEDSIEKYRRMTPEIGENKRLQEDLDRAIQRINNLEFRLTDSKADLARAQQMLQDWSRQGKQHQKAPTPDMTAADVSFITISELKKIRNKMHPDRNNGANHELLVKLNNIIEKG